MVFNYSPGDGASIGTSVTLIGQIFKLTFLGHYVSTMLYVMTSGEDDLNIDLTPKKVLSKSYRSFNEISNAVCCLSLQFVVFEI